MENLEINPDSDLICLKPDMELAGKIVDCLNNSPYSDTLVTLAYVLNHLVLRLAGTLQQRVAYAICATILKNDVPSPEEAEAACSMEVTK